MNKYLLMQLVICFTLISSRLMAQSVGVNNPTPDASAALDVVSTSKGVLVPRMTAAQRNLIASPATGLLVYQTDEPSGFYFYANTTWTLLGAAGPQGLKGDTGDTGETGPQGLKGDKGDAGEAGPQGLKGDKGDTGETGPQGLKGDKGDTGEAGPQGLKGDQGIQGLPGTAGTNGQGVPTGGTAGQVLSKIDGTDFNTQWTTPAFAASGVGYVLNPRNPANYGVLGGNSVDFSRSSGPSTTKGATGLFAFASGFNTTASGNSSIAMGYISTASGISSVALGENTTASGQGAFAMGSETSANGEFSTSLGKKNIAGGASSTAFGNENTATGMASTATGFKTVASGDYSLAAGIFLNARSFGEAAVGSYNTDYVPSAPLPFLIHPLDRAFSVGIGSGENDRKNGLIVYKSGNTDIGGQIKINANTAANTYTLPLNRGTANQVLVTDGAGATSWATASTGNTGWGLSGNSGTVEGTNFIGNTDNKALEFRINNIRSGYLSNSTGDNTSFGYSTLSNISTGYGNTAIGRSALRSVTSGNSNSSLGSGSLLLNTSGNGNSAFGARALQSNNTASNNTAVGAEALFNSNGPSNTAVGSTALLNNTTGGSNVAVGSGALQKNSTSSGNVAVGNNALLFNTTGESNVAFGLGALLNNTTAFYNTALGANSLSQNTTGGSNAALGRNALSTNTTGSNNTAVGTDAGVASDNLSNTTAIGSGAIVDASNKIRLGDNAVTATDIAGQVKVNAQSTTDNFTLPATRGTANQVLSTDGAGATSWVTASSGGSSDNLGNHTATQDLNLNGNAITNATNITATGTATLGGNAYPITTGTNGQVLTTNGAGTLSWGSSSSGGAVLDLVAVKTATSAQTTAIGSSLTDPDVITFDAPTTEPTIGSFNNTTDVYTVGANGLYYIEVTTTATVANIPCVPAIQLGTTWNDGDDIFGLAESSNNFQNPYKARGFISAMRFLTAGTTIRARANSTSNVVGAALSTDGTTRMTIVKLN
jgi:trimeric autotransporter adhesin